MKLYSFATIVWIFLILIGLPYSAAAQTTAFTYQGRLQDGGTNANGSYDFHFTLWDAARAGTQQPQPSPVTVTKTGVAVSSGVFTVQLDFGASAFPGAIGGTVACFWLHQAAERTITRIEHSCFTVASLYDGKS